MFYPMHLIIPFDWCQIEIDNSDPIPDFLILTDYTVVPHVETLAYTMLISSIWKTNKQLWRKTGLKIVAREFAPLSVSPINRYG
jgi:hypothetical protein